MSQMFHHCVTLAQPKIEWSLFPFLLWHISLSKCQWWDSNPHSYNFDASILPLCCLSTTHIKQVCSPLTIFFFFGASGGILMILSKVFYHCVALAQWSLFVFYFWKKFSLMAPVVGFELFFFRLLVKCRLGWKGLPGSNNFAFYEHP
jgi:hypothetical protein